MRPLRLGPSLAVLALVVAACGNRNAEYCDHLTRCAAEEGVTLHEPVTGPSCADQIATEADRLSDACFDCLERLPCEVVNDCTLRSRCHESKLECRAVCP